MYFCNALGFHKGNSKMSKFFLDFFLSIVDRKGKYWYPPKKLLTLLSLPDSPQLALLCYAAARPRGHGEGKVPPWSHATRLWRVATAGVTSLGSAKGSPCLLLPPSWFSGLWGGLRGQSFLCRESGGEDPQEVSREDPSSLDGSSTLLMLAAGKGHCSLLLTLGEMFSRMG